MVSQKHFVNDPSDLVVDSIEGFVQTNNHLKFDKQEKVVYVKDIDIIKEKQVTLFCGGGSGHEPAHVGFVGPAFLTAAVSGHVFASPSSSQVLSCLRRVYSQKHGTIVIVKNYTGDILNFGRAIESFKSEQSEKIDVGRRGLSGTILVNKIACAAAATGASFEAVEKIAQFAAENVFTVGCALDPASVPGSGLPRLLDTKQIEFGMGIHNEPGFKTTELSSAHNMVKSIVDHILSSKLFTASTNKNSSSDVVVLINNLGALSNLELGLVSNEVINQVKANNISITRAFQGTFMTGLAMPGVSVSILVLPSSQQDQSEVLNYIDTLALAPGWSNQIHTTDASTKSDQEVLSKNSESLVSVTATKNIELKDTWVNVVNSIYTSVKDKEPEVTLLDSIMGDGDCGHVLLSGAKSVFEAINNGQVPTDNTAEAIASISRILESSMGGTSGIIYCLFFDGVSQYLTLNSNDSLITPSTLLWSGALKNGLETIQRYSTAKLGDRTLIDSLAPFISEFSNSNGNLQSSLDAARKGAEKTKDMIPLRGRAVYTGKGSGNLDAGAVGVCVPLAESADELQKSFNTLTECCKRWDMNVNSKKCGIMAINCSTDTTFKMQNQLIPYMGCYSILKRNDIPSKFKVMVIKAIIQAVATYAKCGKSAAMVRLRQELSLTDLNIKTAVARTRAFGKWAGLKTWISVLIKCPYKHKCDTWVSVCTRWIKKYNGNINKIKKSIETLNNRQKKNNKSKYPNGYLILRQSGFIKKRFIEEYLFRRNIASETIEHMLLELATKSQLLPAPISMKLFGKLLGGELKLPSTMIRKDPTVLCDKTTLATAKFLNAIALPRYLILKKIRLAPIPSNQCPPGTATLESQRRANR
ncbi:hypothetical protein BB561_005699 [Smittium simulii]|uniref:DhaK domain-containing protein n=1 Tax=Smittium simulii TaxID=133385 RepID=A0A2T9Y8W5_9FUNG|nr:hypothetical protein BB561_005699 [Smittium simulii]